MAVSLFESAIYGGLFGDAEFASLFSDGREISDMVAFERVLAEVEGTLGVIPDDAAAAIKTALQGVIKLDKRDIAAATAADGVPVPAFVRALRATVPDGHGHWIHWGATSQDVIDSARMLALRDAGAVMARRLASLIATMKAQALSHSGAVMAAHTRGQIATPITFGLRIAQWSAPLIASANEAPNDAFRVQFGGASGANTAVAPHGPAIASALADRLGLKSGAPWHTNRRPIREIADWYLGIAEALAKFAEDLLLMTRNEAAEVRAGAGGASSTMPQKSNPVQAEAIIALTGIARAARAGLSVPHREERDGAAWAMEWALLPQIVIATGAALRHAQTLAETLEADTTRMRQALDAHPGVMAEAASFALTRQMDRQAAAALVKEALADHRPFAEALTDLSPIAIDWAEALSPEQVIAPCRALIDEIFAER